jgi:iron-sulfur cluster assembly accessory protein
MQAEATTSTAPFSVSANAFRRLAVLLQDEPQGSKLRVAVDGGGCSGFQYRYEFTQEKTDDDFVISENGIEVLIDSVSQEFVKGSVLDFIETLGESHFSIKNPNATANCGCGNSFAV